MAKQQGNTMAYTQPQISVENKGTSTSMHNMASNPNKKQESVPNRSANIRSINGLLVWKSAYLFTCMRVCMYECMHASMHVGIYLRVFLCHFHGCMRLVEHFTSPYFGVLISSPSYWFSKKNFDCNQFFVLK